MSIRKFLVQIEDGETTRWFIDDKKLLGRMAGACGGVCANEFVTQGAVPSVTVTIEEDRNPIDERARQ
jgi:hypothetical protein